jgi:hypothetical protein
MAYKIKQEKGKKQFIKYLEEQQGKDYVEEQQYYQMPFETIKELETDSYEDFKGEEK